MQRAKTTREQAIDGLTAIQAELTAPEQESRPMEEPYSDEQAKREAAMLEDMEWREAAWRNFLANLDKQAAAAREVLGETAITAEEPTPAQEARQERAPNSAELAAEQVKREAADLDEMERQAAARQAFLAEKEKQAAAAREAEEERRKTAEPSEEASRLSHGEITDAQARYAKSLGDSYDPSSPYRSLARAAMDEYGTFMEQQTALTRAAAAEADPDKRRLIELRKEIEGNEYLALGSARLVLISEVVTGNLYRPGDYEKAVQEAKERGEEPRELTQPERDAQNAKHYSNNAKALREERAHLQEAIAEREQGQPATHQQRPDPVRSDATPTQARREPEQTSKAKQDDEERGHTARQAHNAAMQGLGPKPTSNMSADAASAYKASEQKREIERLREEREEKLRQQRDRQAERGRGRGGKGGR